MLESVEYPVQMYFDGLEVFHYDKDGTKIPIIKSNIMIDILNKVYLSRNEVMDIVDNVIDDTVETYREQIDGYLEYLNHNDATQGYRIKNLQEKIETLTKEVERMSSIIKSSGVKSEDEAIAGFFEEAIFENTEEV